MRIGKLSEDDNDRNIHQNKRKTQKSKSFSQKEKQLKKIIKQSQQTLNNLEKRKLKIMNVN